MLTIHRGKPPKIKFLNQKAMIPLGRAERAMSHLLRAVGRHNAALRTARAREAKEQNART